MSKLQTLTLTLLATYGDTTDLDRAKREAAAILAAERNRKLAEAARNRRRAAGATPRQSRPTTPLTERARALGMTPKALAAEIGCTPQAVRVALAGDGMRNVSAKLVDLLARLEATAVP